MSEIHVVYFNYVYFSIKGDNIMIKETIKDMKRCCNNCRNYTGNFCKVITCSHPNTKNDPDNFYCAYFKRNKPLIVSSIDLVAKCISAVSDKVSEALEARNGTYTVKPEDIKEDK